MGKLRVSVVGCGSWGRNHARVYNEIEKASLVAVVDAREEVAREIGERYGVEWYTNCDEVFERSDVEAVSICTPTTTHAELALRAIRSGKHVLVEKPMTDTVEEARELIRAAMRQGVHLAVGFVERFNPAVMEAVRLVSSREVGDVILAHARRVGLRPVRISDVGVIKDLGIHDIDVVTQLFKDELEKVYAVVGSIAHRFEDYANIILKFKGDRNAFIETNWLTPRKVRRLIITGTEGLINVEYITQEIRIEKEKHLYQPLIGNREPLKLELQSFVDSILRDEPPRPSGEEGLRALKICEAALESARIGRPVKFRED
ncbi:Gfo/Idh/MocA family oxidoreductase [Candidatus Bathyarchaeota archaeon]|nr:Gfo/Idh/MocA family oxidoreductase [Candidatus Bathyarchaeota archaeon]